MNLIFDSDYESDFC